MDDDQRALYIISVAAELAGVHPQTLRIYERKGLIEPSRTEGRSRRYSDRDIALLQRIQELTNEGVSLAGVRRILELEAEARGAARPVGRPGGRPDPGPRRGPEPPSAGRPPQLPARPRPGEPGRGEGAPPLTNLVTWLTSVANGPGSCILPRSLGSAGRRGIGVGLMKARAGRGVVAGRRRVGISLVVGLLAVSASLVALTVGASAQKGQDDGVNAALTTATITSAGPLSNVYLGSQLNCQVDHTGDTVPRVLRRHSHRRLRHVDRHRRRALRPGGDRRRRLGLAPHHLHRGVAVCASPGRERPATRSGS